MHAHVNRASGEAEFWMEPEIELAQNYGIRSDEANSLLNDDGNYAPDLLLPEFGDIYFWRWPYR
jgi:hypothetical protein